MSIDATPGEHAAGSLTQQQIFISYRRSDTQASVGRLADHLREYYGEHRVYRDLDSNRPAADYVGRIEEALAASSVVLVVIGPDWLTCTGDGRRSRLHDPGDLVRQEVAQALANNLIILPVLVEGAEMPQGDQLPGPLQPLARHQAHRLRDEQWEYDMARLLEALVGCGILPHGDDDEPGLGTQARQALTEARRYERTLKAFPRPVYTALAGAVRALRYSRIEEDPQAGQVRFNVYGRRVTAKVLEGEPGYSSVVVEFTSVRAAAALPALLLLTNVFGVAAGAGVLALERRFAKGFLDNVQRMVEGRGVGEDSSLPPGLGTWRKKRGRL